jgi:hypothetical protein
MPSLVTNALIGISQRERPKLSQEIRIEEQIVEQPTRHVANAPVRVRQALAKSGNRRGTGIEE